VHGILPGVKQLTRVQPQLNAHAQESKIPFTMDGNKAEFVLSPFLDFIVDKYGMKQHIEDANSPPVQIGVMLDSAKLSKFQSHVIAGLKMVDQWCVDLITKLPLFGEKRNEKIESNCHCFPIKTCITKDTKLLYKEEFHPLFLHL